MAETSRSATEPQESLRRSTEAWMTRALELARKGVALAHPNPMVGALVVRDDRVVGEGFHTYDGRKHAEVIALEAAGEAARGARLYVTLEPCSHTGRTGPCTEAILRAGVRHVVAAMRDPNPGIAGHGLAQLEQAGVQVSVGMGEAEARRLNEGFATWITTGQPFVTLKSALTLDGQIALARRTHARLRSKTVTWITSEESRAEVQRMRHASDALLTGIGTVLADNPLLTDRTGEPRRRKLLRVVLDSRLRMPLRSNLVKAADGDVLVMTLRSPRSARARMLHKAGVEVMQMRGRKNRLELHAVLKELGRREILGVLLEAGSELNGAALEAGIVDKLFLFYAPILAGAETVRVAATQAGRGRTRGFTSVPPLSNISIYRFGPDFAVEGYLRDVYRNH